VLREHKPDCLAVVFDERGPTQRHVEYAAYKAQRPEMPQGMSAQIPYIHRIVEALALPIIRKPGYEADDLIGSLARQAERQGYQVVIVTSDKDMFQLLTPAVRIYDPVKDKWFGEAECRERFGVEPARVVEIMGLMGDAIDNIPGVKGIGEKTAIKLITQFGTIEELLRRIDEVPGKTKTLLTEQAEAARMSRGLATIQVDCPVEFDCEAYRVAPPPQEPLIALFREFEFPTLLKTIQPTVGTEVLGSAVERIQDETAARRFATMVQGSFSEDSLAFHCLLKGPPGVRADLQGLAFSLATGAPVFTSPQGGSYLPKPLIDLLKSPTRVKAMHDLKPALLALNRAGVEVAPPWFDTMIAAYLLNPNRRTHTLESVALDVLGYHL
jgi:DNA polymerase-1